jgi:hypothetical protein
LVWRITLSLLATRATWLTVVRPTDRFLSAPPEN